MERLYGGKAPVKPHIRARVTFEPANLLDPDIVHQFGPADLVFMQNVLCHLDPAPATEAFRNGVQFLKPRSALFIDGMSLDLRERLTSEAGLVPLDYACREIHEFARTHVGERWWNYYYGMEPYASWHRDRLDASAPSSSKRRRSQAARRMMWSTLSAPGRQENR